MTGCSDARRPEQSVVDEIDALVDWQIAQGEPSKMAGTTTEVPEAVESVDPGRYYVVWWRAEGMLEVGTRVLDVELEFEPYLHPTPRGVNTEDAGGVPFEQWVYEPEETALFVVKPVVVGEVVDVLADDQVADEWLVSEELPIGQLLGPQAEEIYRVVRNLEGLHEHPWDSEVRSEDEWERLSELYENADEDYAREHAVMAAADAAIAALHLVGDRNGWEYLGSCQHGCEYAAIAARDLIGTVPGWTQQAYDLVMARYRRTFGREDVCISSPVIVGLTDKQTAAVEGVRSGRV